MFKISLDHLLDLVDCGIIFIERRNGTHAVKSGRLERTAK